MVLAASADKRIVKRSNIELSGDFDVSKWRKSFNSARKITRKLARLTNLTLFVRRTCREVRSAIIYRCPQAAAHKIDPTKFPRSGNSCGTLGIRRPEVEPSNLTDGCPAICNKQGHVHPATWNDGSTRRICRQITLFWRLGTANPQASRHQYRRPKRSSIPLDTGHVHSSDLLHPWDGKLQSSWNHRVIQPEY